MKEKYMKNTKLWGTITFTVIGLIIGLGQPFKGLSPQGHYIFGAVMITLGFWIFKPGNLPYFAGAAFLIGAGLIFGLPLTTVGSGFLSSAVWTLIPALYFGFVLQKTGLGKRIAYFVLKSFNPSYLTIMVSWLIIGLILSALTPSITVRLSIMMPIAIGVVEACKLPDKSRGSALICMLAWATAVLPGTGWLTGSLWGPFMMGFIPPELKYLATFDMWFKVMAVPWFIVTGIFVTLLYLFLRPKKPLNISSETFKKNYEALGKITRQEIITGIVLIGALILFTTEKYHKIPTAATALLIFTALIIFQIIGAADIGTGVNWDVICFFGVAVSLSAIFSKAGIASWMRPFIEPSILSFAALPIMFLLVITIGLWFIRFIDVPWGFSTIALTSSLMIPLYHNFGLHPLFVSVAVIAGGNSFFLAYQQPFVMIGDAMMKGRGWSNGYVSLSGALYAGSVIVAILVSSFYWKAIGVIPA